MTTHANGRRHDATGGTGATTGGRATAARGAPGPWTVLGRTVALPVEVRRATQWSAHFLVPLAAAERVVAPAGLRATGPVPGRALVTLAVCRYDDTDLDAYHEVAVSFAVRPHAAAPAGTAGRLAELATGDVCAYIHRLPVDGEFTCAAGRDVWGFPKWVTTIDIDEERRGPHGRAGTAAVRLVDDGVHVLSLSLDPSGPLRLPDTAPPTYSFRDGVLRRTAWSMRQSAASGRPGGTHVVLGDHPMADELRSLGLPRRAVATTGAGGLWASFGAAEVVAPPVGPAA